MLRGDCKVTQREGRSVSVLIRFNSVRPSVHVRAGRPFKLVILPRITSLGRVRSGARPAQASSPSIAAIFPPRSSRASLYRMVVLGSLCRANACAATTLPPLSSRVREIP